MGKRNQGPLTRYMDLAGVGQKGLAEPNVIAESTLKKWIAGSAPASYEIRQKVYRKLTKLLIEKAPTYKRRDVESVFEEIHAACETSQDACQNQKENIWNVVAASCAENIEYYVERHPKADNQYYVERAIECHVDLFIKGDRSAMVIVGPSGMGKSTLVVHVLNKLQNCGHLCFILNGASLPTSVADVERYIVDRLLEGFEDKGDFWARINNECTMNERRLILCIDAVNEYDGAGTRRALVMDFLLKLDELVGRAYKTAPNVRYLITSRPETWRRGAENERLRVRKTGGAYYVSGRKLAVELGRFDEKEARDAYDKYCKADKISTPLEHLSELTRYHLRDPLLLKLACESYKGQPIPRDLDANRLFREYDRRVRTKAAVQYVIDAMVRQMFGSGEFCDILQRDTIARRTDLAQSDRILFEELDWTNITSTGFTLVDQSVIRVDGDLVRFVYDRYAEYLFSEQLIAKIEAKANRCKLTDAAFEVLKANLVGAQKFGTVFGALRRTLRELQRRSTSYAALVRRLATDGEQGMALVISVMATIAMGRVDNQQGIDALVGLLNNLEKHSDSSAESGTPTAFLIIDAVYRVLLDGEYRAWLKERPDSERERHLAALDRYFVRGIEHPRDDISAAVIQYVFFLWQSPTGRPDAMRITERIVESVGTGRVLLGQGGLLRNVTSLFLLAFAEAQNDVPGEARDDAAEKAILELARRLLRRIHIRLLDKVSQFVISGFQEQILDWTLRNLPNPVNFEGVREVIEDTSVRKDVQDVISLLRPEGSWDLHASPQRLVKLARSQNSVVLELLSVALSLRYERLSADDAREQYLSLLRRLFFEESLPPAGEYVCAIALYHINYFGDFPTAGSMHLMESMAEHILQRHRGEFTIRGKAYNYHIIGTYGRALRRNGRLMSKKGELPAALDLAIRALEDAKRRQDHEFYLYLCRNIGLLGVLARPEDVFDVINHILEDIGEKPRPNDEALPFPFDRVYVREAIRESVLNSLANIRVLYKADVDRYLLDVVDDQRLFTEVAMKRRPSFSLAEFYSWTCERLIFTLIKSYYEQVGRDLLDALSDGFAQRTMAKATQLFVKRLLKRLVELSIEEEP